ncbi:MAG: hypothetical protein QOK36_2849 [Gaiellales bacterium]|nr:hypothetical protein [Gaiellales bacterium]
MARAAERAGGAYRPTHYKRGAAWNRIRVLKLHTVENELPTARLLIA